MGYCCSTGKVTDTAAHAGPASYGGATTDGHIVATTEPAAPAVPDDQDKAAAIIQAACMEADRNEAEDDKTIGPA